MKDAALILLICSLISTGLSPVAGAQDYSARWQTVDGGGGKMSGTGWSVNGTVGQPDAGSHGGDGYVVGAGFWMGGVPMPVSPTPTATPAMTETPTHAPTATTTPHPTPSDTPHPTATRTAVPTWTPTEVPTETPTATSTPASVARIFTQVLTADPCAPDTTVQIAVAVDNNQGFPGADVIGTYGVTITFDSTVLSFASAADGGDGFGTAPLVSTDGVDPNTQRRLLQTSGSSTLRNGKLFILSFTTRSGTIPNYSVTVAVDPSFPDAIVGLNTFMEIPHSFDSSATNPVNCGGTPTETPTDTPTPSSTSSSTPTSYPPTETSTPTSPIESPTTTPTGTTTPTPTAEAPTPTATSQPSETPSVTPSSLVTVTPTLTAIPGDTNGDGLVNAWDCFYFSVFWQQEANEQNAGCNPVPPPPGGENRIDGDDLYYLIKCWQNGQ